MLTKEQAAIYNEVVRRGMMEIENCKDNHFVRHALVLRMLVQLKQICDAPALFEPSAGFDDPGLSGKMSRLLDILAEMKAAGRKVLIFT